MKLRPLGKLKYFLGIKVTFSNKGISISQQKYTTNLLQETCKMTCKPVSTLVDPNVKLGKEEDDMVVDKEMYQRFIGRLIYLV